MILRWLRTLHRWFAICAALLFLVIAGSGVWLQFAPDRMEARAPEHLSDAEIVSAFRNALPEVHRLMPGRRIGTVFMNIEGTLPLLTISAMPQAVAPAENGRPMIGPQSVILDMRGDGQVPPISGLHGTLLRVHNSLFLGTAGRWVCVTCGVILLGLGISGLVFFFDLWRLRIARGLGSPFWMTSRRQAPGFMGVMFDIHRGSTTLVAAFMVVIAVSGLLMQFGPTGLGLWGGGAGPLPMPANPVAAPDMTDAQLVQVLARALALGRAQDPHPDLLFMIDFNGNGPSTHVSLTYPSDTEVMYSRIWDARSFAPIHQTGPFRTFFWLLRLHRGDLFHDTGIWVNIATGTGLLLFVLSGVLIYVQMYLRRARLGRRGMFWK